MSWESTAHYYSDLNEGIKAKLGGLHSAKIAMVSVDFAPIEKLQHLGDWDATADILIDAAKNVEVAGADFVMICTNTMHEVAPKIEEEISIPILHIADATADAIKDKEFKKVGLLGTAFKMKRAFYKGRLADKHNIEVITPNDEERKIVHDVIYQELCLGEIKDTSKAVYLKIIERLAKAGAEAVILGCTEIGMLVNQSDTNVILLDTTAIHAEKAVELATE